MQNEKNGSTLLVDCLVQQGVQYIFGIPGAKIDAVYDALIDSPVKVIVCRHEQNAAFMAAAYGRITGKPGVVLVTSGPGVSNLATGLLTATTEGDPIVAIGGNVARNMSLKSSHQSTDNIKLMEAVTKARMAILMTENIPEIIENAFRIATEPRSGAVFISIPQDISHQSTTIKAPKVLPAINYGPAPDKTIQKAATLLNQARRPVLLLGLEATRAENTQAIRQLLTKTPLAVVCTYQAAGVITRELLHCFVGRVGLFKNQPGDRLIDEADVIATIGYDPVEYDPEIWSSASKKIIHLDYKPAEIHTTYMPELEVIGDIALSLRKLAPELNLKIAEDYTRHIFEYQKELKEKISSGAKFTGKLLHPLRFIYELNQVVDDNMMVISDIGTHYMWLARYFYCYQPHHLLFSNGQQTLGVALPWAIAACLVYPKKTVISVSGDGGFLFSANELETAVREQVHFIHFVWCDGSYDMVREQQLMKYKRDSAVHFGPVDIVKYAESFGALGLRVSHSSEFSRVLKEAMQAEGPVLVEIPIDYSDSHELFTAAHDFVGD
ncbi:acetolactate synthase [Legionella antarctica]|uniref:Acetolactate synthase n=1 Tax=Legionella antarctica TaxID=2708020 RepID=A0A6F8T2G1_9GAMM|nr:acetolactate synthase AlsS [Legionella antarctica]BCA94413.1 acetolactate synthase [Legionella antarctica]